MPTADVMAESKQPNLPQADVGAPIAKDAIDPELVKLRRKRTQVGVITSAGLVFLSILFVWRLGPDRRFGGAGSKPEQVSVADVLAGNVGTERFVRIDAEPVVASAIRTTTSKGSLGLRVVPARGTGERLWLVLSGDGWEPPALGGYVGRLRKLADLPLAPSVKEFAADHSRPVFATVAAIRAGFAAGKVATVAGDEVALADRDRVAFDVIDRDAATVVCTFNDKHPSAASWQTALADAGFVVQKPIIDDVSLRFELAEPNAVAAAVGKLEHAELWAARVDPVTHHRETTWGALRGAPATLPDNVELVGVFVTRAIPDDAYAVITGEHPDDYWYVMYVTVIVGVIGLLFAWALVRAVRRDVLTPRVP